MKKILSIAGSDCSGGAGIQADIKTITCHKMYAMTAITALTAQNTTGVYGVMESDRDFLGNQLDCIFEDIYPDAIKIGMVSSPELIDVIVDRLIKYKASNIVLDPVMLATSGNKLMKDTAFHKLIEELLPLATIITPNMKEAEVLSRCKIGDAADMEQAAVEISRFYSGNILIKGGHLKDRADDYLYHNSTLSIFKGEHINNDNTHGTGCTLSSAIACNLAAGYDISLSVARAKAYINEALKTPFNIGKGNGPLQHNYMDIDWRISST